MSKSSLILIIYIIGIIFGAFFLDLWGSETNVKKGLIHNMSAAATSSTVLILES